MAKGGCRRAWGDESSHETALDRGNRVQLAALKALNATQHAHAPSHSKAKTPISRELVRKLHLKPSRRSRAEGHIACYHGAEPTFKPSAAAPADNGAPRLEPA